MTEQSSNPRLDAIIAEYLAKSQPTASDREQLISQYPDLADELNAFFGSHDQMKFATKDATNPSSAPSIEDPTIPPFAKDSEEETIPPVRSAAQTEMPTLPPPGSSGIATAGAKVRYFGDYELLEEIARGGMGVVYKARQTSLNRTVALKMILAGQLAGDEDVQRFQAEAEAAANLDHIGIVPIYEIGEHEGQHYFSMGYVEGESLSDRVKDGPLPPREAAEYTKKIAEAVAFAHEQGVIHRDLKPANVLLDRTGEPKVTDFGLAKKIECDSGLTATGQILGTPSYMPPEQASGKIDEVKETADVYSLGAILYALLTGRPPFQASNHLDTLIQVTEKEPLSVRVLNSKVPRDLETISIKCLHKEGRRRYQSAKGLAEELRRHLDGEPIHARPIGPISRTWMWCRRKPWVASLVATVVLLLVSGTTISSFFAWRARENADIAEHRLYAHQIASAYRTWEAGDVASAFDLLEACQMDLRGWEHDYLFSRFTEGYLNVTEPDSIEGFDDRIVRSVVFSPDGRRFASSGRLSPTSRRSSAQINVSDGETGKTQLVIEGHSRCVAFSPDGRRIAGGSGPNKEDVRVWDSSSGKLLMTLSGHKGEILSVAFFPDGKRIASSSSDRSIKVWDSSDGSLIRTLVGHKSRVHTVTVSTDGRHIASSSGSVLYRPGQVIIWDSESGNTIRSLKGHATPIESLAFSPDGTHVVGGGHDSSLRVWDISTGRSVMVMHGHRAAITQVRYSLDGSQIVSASLDKVIKVWGASEGELRETLKGHQSPVNCVDISPDMRRIVSGGKRVKLWNAGEGQQPGRLSGHSGNRLSIQTVAFSPNGQLLATGCGDSLIKVWNAVTGRERVVLSGHSRRVHSLAFRPDGKRIISGSSDRTIKIWNTEDGKLIRTLRGHKGYVLGVAYSPDGSLIASASSDKTIKFWRDSTGEEARTITGHRSQMTAVGFSPDSSKVICGGGPEAKIWDVETGRETLDLSGRQGYITHVGFTADGSRVVLAGIDSVGNDRGGSTSLGRRAAASGQVKIWDAETGEQVIGLPKQIAQAITFLMNSEGARNTFSLSPDGRVIATANGAREVTTWNVKTGKRLRTYSGPNAYSVAFSPNGREIVSGGRDGTLTYWNTESGTRIRTLVAHDGIKGRIQDIAISPDGERIATCAEGSVKVWNVRTRDELLSLEFRRSSGADCVAFSAEGDQILTGSGSNRQGTVKLWDAESGREIRAMQGHKGSVYDVAFGPKGKRGASGSRDGTIKLWDIETGELIVSIDAHKEGVNCLIFDSTGTRLISGGNQSIKLWSVRSGELVRAIDVEDRVHGLAQVNSTLLVSGHNRGQLILWSTATGSEIMRYDGHTEDVLSVAFSPDGSRIASGSRDGSVRIWERTSGLELLSLTEHKAAVTSVLFSPDGARIISGGFDGKPIIWDASRKAPLPAEGSH